MGSTPGLRKSQVPTGSRVWRIGLVSLNRMKCKRRCYGIEFPEPRRHCAQNDILCPADALVVQGYQMVEQTNLSEDVSAEGHRTAP
jgi:hypothetical protein